MKNYMSIIEANENEVASIILENHSRELAIIDAGLEEILRGYMEFASRKEWLDDELGELGVARLLLVVKSFNSLHVAMKALRGGYTQQPVTLIRTVMEDQLVVQDAENHTPTLDALFGKENKLVKNELTFGKMAERVSPKRKAAWDHNYGFASGSAAHPRPSSMLKHITVDPYGKKDVQPPGGRYDRVEVNEVISLALRELLQVMVTMAKLAHSVGSNWADDALPVIEKVNSLYYHIDEEAKKEFEEMDKTPE